MSERVSERVSAPMSPPLRVLAVLFSVLLALSPTHSDTPRTATDATAPAAVPVSASPLLPVVIFQFLDESFLPVSECVSV